VAHAIVTDEAQNAGQVRSRGATARRVAAIARTFGTGGPRAWISSPRTATRSSRACRRNTSSGSSTTRTPCGRRYLRASSTSGRTSPCSAPITRAGPFAISSASTATEPWTGWPPRAAGPAASWPG
jgi:hypothetical protein